MNPILARRSIRRFAPRPLEEEDLSALLAAALAAPSAHNQRPWHFVVSTRKDRLEEIPAFHPYSSMMRTAAAAVLVCGEPASKDDDFLPQDLAAATENLLVAATARGIGSCWLGVYPKEPLMGGCRRWAHLPQTVIPFALVALGWPEETKAPHPEEPDPSRIHRETWER